MYFDLACQQLIKSELTLILTAQCLDSGLKLDSAI